MASTRSGKVVYVPNPKPHPEAGDAPRTGVPANPVPPKSSAAKWAKDVG
jgi:hypothetical protein